MKLNTEWNFGGRWRRLGQNNSYTVRQLILQHEPTQFSQAHASSCTNEPFVLPLCCCENQLQYLWFLSSFLNHPILFPSLSLSTSIYSRKACVPLMSRGKQINGVFSVLLVPSQLEADHWNLIAVHWIYFFQTKTKPLLC